MGAIGWIWAWLMLLGGLRAQLAQSLPAALCQAMLISGVLAVPLLWNRDNGLLAAIAPSGIVRASLALLILVGAGITYPDAVMGLISA